MSDLICYSKGGQGHCKTLPDKIIHHVMTVTDEEFANITVTKLAKSFNTNRFKLSRQFKKKTNMTLETFLLKEKMIRAVLLLKTYNNITVTEISEKVGFSTCDYFIRRFRQYYGIAPGKFRELKSFQSEA